MLFENQSQEGLHVIKTLSFATLLCIPIVAFAATFLGPGSSAGKLGDLAEMHRICRETYSEEEKVHGNVRWASTTDYLQANNGQGWGGESGHEFGLDQVALRAEHTVFTPDGRSYDEATGALSPANNPRFPGAVVITQQRAWFAGRAAVVTPMCVYGSSNFTDR